MQDVHFTRVVKLEMLFKLNSSVQLIAFFMLSKIQILNQWIVDRLGSLFLFESFAPVELTEIHRCSVVLLFVTQEKIKALQAELQVVTNSKTMLEKELQEVITLTSTELEEYQEKVLELEDEVNIEICAAPLCY